MKIKIILILLLLSIVFNPVFASGSNNPNAKIYDSIDYWRATGLIEKIPPIRPYPAQYIISILEEVIKSGSPEDVKIAKEYLEYFTTNNLDLKIKSNNFTSFDEHQTLSGVAIDANVYLNEYVTAGIDINGYVLNGIDKNVTPPSRNIGIDLNVDNMGFSAFGREWELQQSLNLNSAFGTEKIWLQTGMMKSSFGPLFDDSVVLNPAAKQAAHFSVTWLHDYFTYSYLFLPIVATDNMGENPSDNKFIHIRSFDFFFTDFWEFQFLETAIYGGRGVKPIFFLPFSEFFYLAGQGGTWDVNSIMGVSSRFQLPSNTSLTATVYVDDVHARDVAAFDFDTKFKLAGQAGFNWTPLKSIISSVDLSYTAVMPYMYTHITESEKDSEYYDIFNKDYDIRSFALNNYMNYENYTNGGISMGPYGLEPNSDKTALSIAFNLPLGLKLQYCGELQRHGNSSSIEDRSYTSLIEDMEEEMSTEDFAVWKADNTNDEGKYLFDLNDDGMVDDAIAVDGTIYDSGYKWVGGYEYNDSTPFLTQYVLEIMVLNELKLTTPSVEFLNGEIYGDISYSYLYVDNYNLIDGETYTGSYMSLSFNYSF